MNCHLVPLFRTWKKLERKLEQPPQRQSDKGLWQPQTYPECSGGLELKVGTKVGTDLKILLTSHQNWCGVLLVGTDLGTTGRLVCACRSW